MRTKENIARVRRDEAKAAEELRETERRIKLAEAEARMSLLRGMASNRMSDEQKLLSPQKVQPVEKSEASVPSVIGHVNFFEELEAGDTTPAINKEREAEQKKEQEEYEKKIGLLTYLGQDTNELTGEKSWWEKIPESRKRKAIEGDDEEQPEETISKQDRFKDLSDPLNTIRQYLGTEGVSDIIKKKKDETIGKSSSSSNNKKHKKHKKKSSKKKSKKKKKKRSRSSSSESSETAPAQEDNAKLEQLRKLQKLTKLREERLRREEQERARANHVLYGVPLKEEKKPTDEKELLESKRKYNSQFNPQIAKQNKLDANQKYWLE